MAGQPADSTERLAQDIDDMAEVLETVIDAVVCKITARIGDLKKHRNRIVPRLHQLPVELFDSIIVHFASLSPHDFQYLPLLGQLRTVCSMWAVRILSNKVLWADIRKEDMHDGNPNKLRKLLERSGSMPLTLQISLDPQVASGAATIIPHAYRLQHAHIDGHCDEVQKLLSQPMPMLESLVIGSQTARDNQSIRNLLGGYGPRLRTLKTSYLLDLPTTDLSLLMDLRELGLYRGSGSVNQNSTRPTLMLQMAVACPQLESLHISYLTKRSTPFVRVEPVTLPHLKSLWLSGSTRSLALLLKAIIAPDCRSYHISDVEGYPDWMNGEEHLRTVLRHCCAFFDERGMTIKVNGWALVLKAYDGQTSTQVEIKNQYIKSGAMLLKLAAEATKIVRLDVSVNLLSSTHWNTFWRRPEDTAGVQELAIRPGTAPEVEMQKLKDLLKPRCQLPATVTPLRRLQVLADGRWEDRLEQVVLALEAESATTAVVTH